MAAYRCDFVRPNGSIACTEMLLCDDDVQAVSKARQLLSRSEHLQDVEVWQRERRVHPAKRRVSLGPRGPQ